MLRIRTIELEIAKRYSQGKMRTPIHLSVGQEAAAVGVCAALGKYDQAVGTHRSHAQYLAMGGSLNAMIAELHGKKTGCSGGHGGSMHLVDRAVGFMGSTSIVGGTIPIGVGLAWAKKLREELGIVVIFHGDAAMEEGVWHESANFASLHKLPVLFVCENNRKSCFTDLKDRQPNRPLGLLAEAHGIPAWHTNAQSPYKIWNIVLEIREFMRHTGPYFLEIETDRYLEHCGPNNDDHLEYRDMEALEQYKANDPLKDMVPTKEMIDEINAAFEFAENSPNPKPVGMYYAG